MEPVNQTNKNEVGAEKVKQIVNNIPPATMESVAPTTTQLGKEVAKNESLNIEPNIDIDKLNDQSIEDKPASESPNKKNLIYAAIAVILLIIFGITFLSLRRTADKNVTVDTDEVPNFNQNISNIQSQTVPDMGKKEKFTQFTSEEDVKAYLEKAPQSSLYNDGIGGGNSDIVLREENTSSPGMAAKSLSIDNPMAMSQSAGVASPQALPSRFSDTNVQFLGIDEPDIVKNDGQQVYFSQPLSHEKRNILWDKFYEERNSQPSCLDCPNTDPRPYPDLKGEIKIIQAFPPQDSQIKGKIEQEGEMLLKDNVLVVFAQDKQKIYGYDLSDPQNPKEKWQVEIKEKSRIINSRLYGDTVYLATESYFNPEKPCPFVPIVFAGTEMAVQCTDIYHPETPTQSDATYNFSSFDLQTGQLKKNTAFVGTAGQSEIYMSKQGIYLTYTYQTDMLPLISDFFNQNKDLVPASLVEKIAKLAGYDLSENAKYMELASLIEQHTRSLDKDETMRFENEMSNRMEKFIKEHSRGLVNTAIVKVAIPDLQILAIGKVPGTPLNQFSLDEYQDHLRVATNSAGRSGGLMGMGSMGMRGSRDNSVNDVYILDNKLDLTGSVQDLGKGERIYSVRFIEDKGYVVTFKQVDPFFVLDLANPANPLLKGELKIPGYSSYLHPIDQNVILGIGEEDGKVKMTLFDVANPSNPQELNTYLLDEYYSEVSNNHHAFLLDKKHQVFFLPGSKGAYVVSYTNNQLSLKKTVSDFETRRALYIDNYLYILSDQKMLVLDENNWEKVKELEL